MREEGLEPSHPYGHRHLKPARLPIPPLALNAKLKASCPTSFLRRVLFLAKVNKVTVVDYQFSPEQIQAISDFVDTSSVGGRRRLPEDQIQRISKYLNISQDEVRSLLAGNNGIQQDGIEYEADLKEIETRIGAINNRLDLLSKAFPE